MLSLKKEKQYETKINNFDETNNVKKVKIKIDKILEALLTSIPLTSIVKAKT